MPNPNREFEEARRMLVRAVAEIKGGEYHTARRYLERILNIPSRADQKADTFYWLSEISNSEDEKREYLLSALGYDLSHHRARKSLAILDKRLNETEIIDPDTFAPQAIDGPQPREGQRFECPNCGSRMVYSPDGKSLICEHCNSQSSQQHVNLLTEQEFVVGISTAKGHQYARRMQAFDCEACGAVFVLAPEVLSLTCPHCGSAYAVIQSEERETIQPEGIIPFEYSERAAEHSVLDWGKKIGYEPVNILPEHFSGIYLPCWTFDVGGVIKWTGYMEYQENQTVPVSDSATIHYDDVFVPGSKPQPEYFRELLEEFRAADVKPYDPGYSASFLAESYQISMSDAAVDARALVFRKAKKAQKEKSGLGKVQNLRFSSDEIFLESYKLVLVPVWMGGLTIENRRLEVLVNGKTGKVYTDKPPKGIRKLMKWLLQK